MFFDAVKRFLGLGGTQPRHENESLNQPSRSKEEGLVPYRSQLPPDITQVESEIAHIHKIMEEQMRLMMGSFGFTFGGPFSGFGFEDDSYGQNRSFPFPPTPNSPHNPIIPSSPNMVPPALDPRDEVFKPQYRSNSSGKWRGQDQILDERVDTEGLDSVLGQLKPQNDVPGSDLLRNPLFDSFSHIFGLGNFGQNGPFGNGILGGGEDTRSISSSSTMTIYSNVNGHTSVEKIVRHPDGSIERTVITNDGNTGQ